MLSLATGAVDTSIDVQIVDDTGLPVTGLVAATFPTLTISRGSGADVAFTALSDLAALTTAHTDGGVKERGGGVYRLDLPDSVASSAATKVTIRGEATNKRLICPPLQVGNLPANALAISGDTVAADNCEAFFDGTGYAGTGNVIPTVTTATNLTNLPTIPANWLTAAGIAASALNGKGDWNIGKTGYKLAADGLDLVTTWTVNITGSLSGAVGSVTGNVGGNVVGSVASVTAAVTLPTIPTNWLTAAGIAADAITAAKIADGAIDRATLAADTGLQSVRSNTAQTGAAGTITLDASASATTDFYAGQWIYLTGGTGAGQSRLITAYNGTTKVATIAPNWATAPDVSSTFAIYPAAKISGVTLVDTLTTYTGDTPQTGDSFARIGAAGAGLTDINLPNQTMDITGNITGNLSGSVGSVTAAITLPTIPTGWLTAAGIAADAITAAKIATGAIDADALAADAVAEILTTQMTESYAADTVAPTLAQAVFMIMQSLNQAAISGTTKTVKKIDKTTAAATFTLDSATDPTSITRAT